MTETIQIATLAAVVTLAVSLFGFWLKVASMKRREGAETQDLKNRLESLERFKDRFYEAKWTEWRARQEGIVDTLAKAIAGQERTHELLSAMLVEMRKR